MDVIKAKGYNIFVGNDLISELNIFLAKKKYQKSKIFILVDEKTHELCLDRIIKDIPAFADSEIIEIECGEDSKSIEICANIWELLLSYEADKNSLLINIGGGVVSDLGGFIASTFKRGISFINIPTTLLAMVDASVGGKVGINLGAYKNQVGNFAKPEAVFISPMFLETLEKRQINSGIAEVVKHAIIADEGYFSYLEKNIGKSKIDWSEIISKSVSIKNEIVNKDFKENGDRKKLNFGHTIGHGIESYFLEKGVEIYHGEAILLGMVKEIELSEKYLGFQDKRRILNLLKKIETESFIYQMKDILPYIKADKKNIGEKINFSLIKVIGLCEVNNLLTNEQIS
ncbi:MAG: 3-dehydroquinate synthase [Bacteroidota bacterium]